MRKSAFVEITSRLEVCSGERARLKTVPRQSSRFGRTRLSSVTIASVYASQSTMMLTLPGVRMPRTRRGCRSEPGITG